MTSIPEHSSPTALPHDAAARKRDPASAHRGDRLFSAAVTAFAVVVLLLPAAMVLELVRASRLALGAFGGSFLTSSTWDPVHHRFGALPFVWGTVVSSLAALALAVPLALGTAIFLAELAPRRVRGTLGFLVDLLAAIPSVVYGFWGIFVLVPVLRSHVEPVLGAKLGFIPAFQGPPLGFGMLAAAVVLAVMIVPTIASIVREVLRAVPHTQREAAMALGATPWDTIWHAVLPSARSGIIGAILLGLGRALGETMAVTMVIGNRPEVSTSLFQPAATMASVLANEFAEADSDLYLSALSEIALLLFGVAVLLNLFARWLVGATKSRAGQSA